mmetsp:Transcript_52306/g.89986  ORF Transcript_52306/g.89986 Transcript_52306/m.89986 type:complete len:246 (-) Transcript_52306:835-1572(-)
MGGPTRPRVGRLDALDLVLHLLVQVLQKLQVLVRGVPVAAAVGLQEGGQHVAEGVGVGVQQPLAHLLVLDEGLVGVLVNEVVHLAGRGAPAHGVAQPLGDLARALVAAVQHALVELGVEQLGAVLQAQCGLQLPGLGRAREGLHHAYAHALARAPRDPGGHGLAGLLQRARVGVVLLDVGQAVLHAINLLDNAVRGTQQMRHNLRHVHSFVVFPTPVAVRVALDKSVTKVCAVLPVSTRNFFIDH